jgi:hypothetical protein
MKKLNYSKGILLLLFLCMLCTSVTAQDDAEPQKVVKLHYFCSNNSVQYLLLESMLKKGKVLTPQQNKAYEIYLDSTANLISKVKTDASGKAKSVIPPSLKAQWDSSAHHSFLVKAGDEELISDYAITKAKIELDTATVDGVKNITATVKKLGTNNEWLPVADVEMKVGIQRNGAILSAGDKPTYTTDSTGSVTVELQKLNIPGDLKGDYTIAAQVEDNDELGNLIVDKTVHWGVPQKIDNTFFDKRTLWSVRSKAPFWLLLLAYPIMIGVWGTLIYLIIQLFKIKKLGHSVR